MCFLPAILCRALIFQKMLLPLYFRTESPLIVAATAENTDFNLTDASTAGFFSPFIIRRMASLSFCVRCSPSFSMSIPITRPLWSRSPSSCALILSPSPLSTFLGAMNHLRSWQYAIPTKMTMEPSVIQASSMVTTPGVHTSSTTNIQTYTRTDQVAVTQKTLMSEMDFTDSPGSATIHAAEIIRRLKAAEPTMVDGPSSPGAAPRVSQPSITASRISGAEEPNAMSVRFATVGFHTCAVMVVPSLSFTIFS
mmetsp:Transcript_4773/g.8674  ORF Transcript_4773/g.8674 Transcript_4773/m.8674 type:complete len:252 (-) Transcript_4773:598-1353(-)